MGKESLVLTHKPTENPNPAALQSVWPLLAHCLDFFETFTI